MQMLEEEEVDVPVSATSEVPKDATKMETDDAPRDDDNMQESKGATDTAEGAAENGAGDSEEKSVPMETDTKVLFVHCIVDDNV
jgi:heat shock protein 4